MSGFALDSIAVVFGRTLEAFAWLYLLFYVMPLRIKKEQIKYITPIYIGLTVLLRELPVIIGGQKMNPTTNYLGMVLQLGLLFYAVSQPIYKNLFFWISYQLMLTLTEIPIVLLGIKLFGSFEIMSGSSMCFRFEMIGTTLLIPLGIVVLKRIWEKINKDIVFERFMNWTIILYPVSMYTVFLINGQSNSFWNNNICIIGFVLYTISYVVNTVMIYVYGVRARKERSNRILEAALKEEQAQSQVLLEIEQNISKLRHDYKNRLLVISKLLEKEYSQEEAKEKVRELNQQGTVYKNEPVNSSEISAEKNTNVNDKKEYGIATSNTILRICFPMVLISQIILMLGLGSLEKSSMIKIVLFGLCFVVSDIATLLLTLKSARRQDEFAKEQEVTFLLQVVKVNNDILASKQQKFSDLQSSLEKCYEQVTENYINNKKSKAFETVDELTKQLEATYEESWCDNPVVNVIITEKLRRFEDELSIKPQVEISIPNEVGVRPIELCSVYSNLLDNAYEALEPMKAEERMLRLSTKYEDPYLIIEVENSAEQKHVSRQKREGHGYGKVILQDIAAKYDGYYKASYKDGKYSTKIILKKI